MNHPVRNLVIIVGVVLAALVLIEVAADGLQAFGTRGHQGPPDFVAPSPQGPTF
jgi:hypothetical protein